MQQGCLCSLSRIPDLIHLTGNGGHQFISIATPLVQGVRGTAHLVACVFQAYSQCENHSVKILFFSSEIKNTVIDVMQIHKTDLQLWAGKAGRENLFNS